MEALLRSEEPPTPTAQLGFTASGRIGQDPSRSGQPTDQATLQARNQSFSFPERLGHQTHSGPDLVSSQGQASGKTAPRTGGADVALPYSSGTATASQQLAGEDGLDVPGRDGADADEEATEVAIRKMRKAKKTRDERLDRERSKNVFRQLGAGKGTGKKEK